MTAIQCRKSSKCCEEEILFTTGFTQVQNKKYKYHASSITVGPTNPASASVWRFGTYVRDARGRISKRARARQQIQCVFVSVRVVLPRDARVAPALIGARLLFLSLFTLATLSPSSPACLPHLSISPSRPLQPNGGLNWPQTLWGSPLSLSLSLHLSYPLPWQSLFFMT